MADAPGASRAPRDQVAIVPGHRVARIPFHVTPRAARVALAVLVAADITLAALALLPVAGFAPFRPWLDPTAAPAPVWAYQTAKVLAAGGLALLMACAVPAGGAAAPTDGVRADRSGWRWLAAILLGASLVRLADPAAPWLIAGPAGHVEIIARAGPLGIAILAAGILPPDTGRAARWLLGLAAAALVAAWWPVEARAVTLFEGTTTSLALDGQALATAQRHGLQGLAATLLVGALLATVRDVQRRSVHYVFRPRETSKTAPQALDGTVEK